jgi:hypothetical protein
MFRPHRRMPGRMTAYGKRQSAAEALRPPAPAACTGDEPDFTRGHGFPSSCIRRLSVSSVRMHQLLRLFGVPRTLHRDLGCGPPLSALGDFRIVWLAKSGRFVANSYCYSL